MRSNRDFSSVISSVMSSVVSSLHSLLQKFSRARTDSRKRLPLPGQSRQTSNEQTWLQIAALFSVFLHLGLLILLPAPGQRGTLPAQTGPMTLQFSTPKPEPEPDPPIQPEPEPEEVEPEPEPIPKVEPEAPETDTDPLPPVPAPVLPVSPTGPDLPLDGPANPESPIEDGELERIQSLLTETLQQSQSDKARDRWLMLEVREPIRKGLTELHGSGVSVSDAQGQGKFLLSFWVDGDGWIYDLALKPAPGVDIDAFGIRDMIARLNPLAAAPAGVKTPIKLQLRVQSLE